MLMLDLVSGLGGASRAMRERGWQVITVDIDPKFNPTIVADITYFHYEGPRPDLVWASPPCDGFAKWGFPETWACNRGGKKKPDLTLVKETKRIIQECHPRFWVVENVAGAREFLIPIFGPVTKKSGSRYLWGEFPMFDTKAKHGKWKLRPSEDRPALRAVIPKGISLALAMAIEQEF